MSTSITILHGNLGNDPEVFRTESNFAIASFSLATKRRVKDGNGYKEVTDWHNIKALGKSAELAEKYLHKGKEIIVTGHNETRSYDSQDGVKRYITEVIVDHIDFCGAANNGNQQPAGNYQGQGPSQGNQSRQQNRGNANRQTQHSGGYQQGHQQSRGFAPHPDDEIPY